MRASTSLLLLLAAAAACTDHTAATEPRALSAALDRSSNPGAAAAGGVFTETNSTAGNAVVAYARGADGALSLLGTYPTGDLGAGGTVDALVSQFALVLSPDRRFLFAVNAGGNSITAFAVQNNGLTRIATVPSGGLRPVSLAATNDVLYALNTSSNSLTGFRIERDGVLVPVPAWNRSLSAGASGGAAVRFSPDGHLLAVTEKGSQSIESYVVNADGSLAAAHVTHSNGAGPFGFDFTPRGQLLVSEAAAGAASSYDAARTGMLSLVSASTSTQQTAPCWLIVSNGGRFAYTANAGSGSISGFAVAADGSLSLLAPSGRSGDLGAAGVPLDLDLTRDGQFLYVLNVGNGSIGAFAVHDDGALTPLADTPGLSPNSGQQGLAAY